MLKICKHCKQPFEIKTTRCFCFKPACEKAHTEYIKEGSRRSSKAWLGKTYAVYKDVKLKSNGKRKCERCGKLITNGNRHWCSTCHEIVSDRVPDYEHVW